MSVWRPFWRVGLVAMSAGALAACATTTAPSDDGEAGVDAITLKSVRLNQTGFRPDFPKIAVVETNAAGPLAWRVSDAAGGTVLRGQTTPRGVHAGSGQSVHHVDFSPLTAAGEGYVLHVDGVGESHPFAVDRAVYDGLSRDLLNYFYQSRAGVPIERAYVQRPDLARRAGHEEEVVSCFEGEDQLGTVWPGCTYELNVTGGWYDAGDHGKYVVNSGIATWTLLNAAERGIPGFDDGRQPMPEAGNGVSDLLDEARYNLRFMMAMQVPVIRLPGADGLQAAVALGNQSDRVEAGQPLELSVINVSGMVHHKVADDVWTPIPTAPHEADRPRALAPPSTAATLHLAAVSAQAARVYRDSDPRFSDHALSVAVRAFEAAVREPGVFAYDNFDGSGAYGSTDLVDEFYWAAAELYVTTGYSQYRAAMANARASLPTYPLPPTANASWSNVQPLGTIALAHGADDPALRAEARMAVLAMAEGYASDMETEGYAIPFDSPQWYWGSMGDLGNRGMMLAMAYDLTGETRYRDAAAAAMDYILGRNPLDQSYVTGYGERAMMNPHHRFWAHGVNARYPAPPPGVVSGGPNNANPADDVAQRLVEEGCVVQTCWADDVDAYALNEVAINWNAPVFWLAAWLNAVE